MDTTQLSGFIGDSNSFDIPLTWQGSAFEPGTDWTLIFTAKNRATDPDDLAVFQKATDAGISVTDTTATVTTVPDDTVNLRACNLVCDIQAQHTTSGEVRTVAFARLSLTRDVTREVTVSLPIYTTEEYVSTGPAPEGTGLVSVTDGVLDTPATLRERTAADAANLRTDLGLGTAATSASTDFAAASHTHAASAITSGTIDTARLGSGSASASAYLRGDQTWAAVSGGSPVVRHVVVGDSLSSSGSGGMDAYSWAAYWSRMVSQVGVTYTNLAVGGRTANTINNNWASEVTPISPATLGGVGYLFALCGTNDIGVTGAAATTVEGYLTSIWSKARTDGFKVVAFTITKGSSILGAEETERVALNTWIRTQSAAWDYLVDLDRLYPNVIGDTRYYDDSLHYSAFGGNFVAKLVKSTIDAGIDLNFSMACVRDVGTFSVPNGAAYTKIPYTTVVEDRFATFSGGTFTAPADGWYDVRFSLAPQSASASIRWILEIYVNNSSYRRVLDITSTDYMLSGSRCIKLSRGDTLDIRANHSSGSSITINASNPASELQIVKMPVYPS